MKTIINIYVFLCFSFSGEKVRQWCNLFSNTTPKYNLILIPLLLFISSAVNAQNFRFTQYEMNPLLLNPAVTGNIAYGYRLSTNYRNQWGTVSVPYSTGTVCFDANIRPDLIETDEIGVGGYIAYDKSGDGGLSIIKFLPSAAFHKSMDDMGVYNIGLGIQAGVVQKSIDFTSLVFPDQYNGVVFDKEIPTSQTFQRSTLWNLDAGVGLIWHYREKGKAISKIQYVPPLRKILEATVGLAINQANNAYETFLFNNSNRIQPRYVFHSMLLYKHSSSFNIIPSMVIMKQNSIKELIFGLDLEYNFIDKEGDISLLYGARYRHKDAFSLNFGFKHNDIIMKAAYDLNHSSLFQASRGWGALEIHMIKVWAKRWKIECPKLDR